MRRLFAALLCLLVVACTPTAQPSARDSSPRYRATLAPVSPSGEPPCVGVSRILQGIEVPLQLIEDGGTPVTFSADLRRAGRELKGVAKASYEPVKSYASGLGGDLLTLTDALDTGRSGAAVATGDVVTNRVRNLRHACTRS